MSQAIGQEFGDLRRHPDAAPPPGAVVLRVESSLFFANAEPVRTQTAAAVDGGLGARRLARPIGQADRPDSLLGHRHPQRPDRPGRD
jgi:MFS superfamily sulfate permease-like transporter